MDKLTSMSVFTRVAKFGSFAAAARDLSMSKAMVTKHVMQLESELKTRLFNRTTRSLSLTEVGNSYLERCQQILQDVEEMEAAVAHLQKEPRGLLKLTAPPVIGVAHIAPAITEFLKLYPELSVDMELRSTQGDVIEEGLDLAICLGGLSDTSLVARRLASSPLVVCGAPSYFAKHGIPETPDDLINHSCLVNWGIQPRDLWRFKHANKDKVVKVSGRMQTNVADVIKIAALEGLGMVMLPKYIVGKHIELGRLQVVLEKYTSEPLEIHAVYPHRKYMSAKVRVFLEFLQKWLPPKVGAS